MKTRALALMMLVGVAAIACTPNQEDEALNDARQVCIDLGFDNEDSEDSSDDDEQMTSGELTEYSDNLDEEVDQAARAARLDQRWDRLSNAVTDSQEWFRQLSISEDGLRSVDERNIAQERAAKLDSDEIVNVIRQECRKALAP
ncbi:hypothetical protein PV729_09275 [Streptomyces europaeiscabiei]|uniref:Lipoprotein n=1 Tax=Streptomyces europaeiscabiei TaxID=146819 RepID=A0ABU4NBI5_9ACTN|nr:hypothetical protein [Streptomyces europaeiscabiei]MDX3541620.1 hypothetical protein [Streptomyces europaeiscabiei]MDX3551961.1 hypothetical protein [Streptomyces europaeiscabiei]MDX3700200.1 hypothetical protein [Streptomyces europaeiscabiei]